MVTQYIPILLAFALAATVAGVIIVLSALLGRGRLRPQRKLETYESGMPLLDSSRRRISVKFFVVAVVFIVFDVEVAFLFPWAACTRKLVDAGSTAPLFEGLAFLALLLIGYAYLWREGAFDWFKAGK
jgi:NADH-quinone oxidoreductase subunit A